MIEVGGDRHNLARVAVIGSHDEQRVRMRAREVVLVTIAEVMPLAAADEAQRRVKKGGLHGRLVLVPDAN